jgi:DNA mismatch repair protein MutL
MNRVRLLSEQVANQIAAGEVIERPASVVKELVENSIDAQSRNIRVDIQAGGRSLMRVTDDGTGMSRDDALLCLERHATSKIRRAEDLAAIATMGFRGEALPSIASVSRFTLVTREREGDRGGDSNSAEGTQILINGGKIVEVRAAGSAPGTTIEVRQIFFNLPARRKFLRTEETESAHIQHYLTLAALAYPEVAFSFYKDSRQVWQLPAEPSGPSVAQRTRALEQRLRVLQGTDSKLLAVDFTAPMPVAGSEGAGDEETAETGLFRVWGLIGAPGVSRSTRDDQHIFVNRRPVDNRGLSYALLEGYHTALMKGRYPVCCLFVEIDPAAVDVNIHPAKREVKFHREFEVRRLMADAIRQTLLKYHGSSVSVPAAGEQRQERVTVVGREQALPGLGPAQVERPDPAAPVSRPVQPALAMGFRRWPQQEEKNPAAPEGPPPGEPPAGAMEAQGQAQAQAPVQEQGESGTGTQVTEAVASGPVLAAPLLDIPLRIIGVVGRLYVLMESDRGLVLLDQHAAHERILFEQMLARLERAEKAASQKLLLPQTVEVSARDAVFLREQLPALARLGVGLSEFGDRTFLLDALPPFVRVGDPRQFVLELVDQLKSAGASVNKLRLGEHVVAKTVCRHAVKANDPLSGRELEKLVEQLRHCALPYTCPHGRPTMIEMTFRDLEKKFGRAQ